ncbi:hypothetical protein QR680_002583 [Steinernema hermaphroditum]|uniref:Aminopeptidase n=1 Tax=Steinernema hermaphroditum TaxID=289476 RepID=A0AA39H379_9BILA|nr:hypothetical protein QR680_002583 [Steinernema hermaphroditum]
MAGNQNAFWRSSADGRRGEQLAPFPEPTSEMPTPPFPIDETEPCLRKSPGIGTQKNVTFKGGCHKQSRADCVRLFILGLLFVAIFIFGAFLALFIGHWRSQRNVGNYVDIREEELSPHTTTLPSFPNATSDFSSAEDSSANIDTPNVFQRNLTVRDVYPPFSNEYADQLFHSNSKNVPDIPIIPVPKSVLPVHYDLHLDFTEISTKEHIFGNVSILFESFSNATDDELIFHAAQNIFFHRIRVRHEGRPLKLTSVRRQVSKKLVRVVLSERLNASWYTLEIEFRTKICQQDGEGVYCYRKQIVHNETDEPTEFVGFTTKFEPTLASSFIPCWDEPRVKASFDITVKHQRAITVLSNTAILKKKGRRKSKSEDVVVTKYAKTPPMPVYLLAFAVGDFQPLEVRTNRNIPLTIWAYPEDFLKIRYAANFTPSIFSLHEQEFNSLYPLSKIDFVAARNFPVGGMENWGLIVFHYSMLLLDSQLEENENMTVDLIAEEYKIDKIITHEVSHQWFGNLVTPYDWQDLWLNEGFATFYTYEFLKHTRPLLALNEYYLRLIQLFDKQSSTERVALVRPVTMQSDLNKMFDRLHLYTKGAVMVRLVKELVGAEEFKEGIQKYLEKNAYQSVDNLSLWAVMPTFSDHGATREKVSQVMESWLTYEGLPEIKLTRNYDDHTIEITQSVADSNRHIVFLREDAPTGAWESKTSRRRRCQQRRCHRSLRHLRTEDEGPEGGRLWTIPFTYLFGSATSSKGQTVRQFWIHNASTKFVDVELHPGEMVLANPQWLYPFKVNYDVTNWRLIIDQLITKCEDIPTFSRLQLLVDGETYLMQSEHPQVYIHLLSYLARENDLGVLLRGLDQVYTVVEMFSSTVIIGPLLVYLQPVFRHFDEMLDYSTNDPNTGALWLLEPKRLTKLYQIRCIGNMPSCDQKKMIDDWLRYPMALDAQQHQRVSAVCHYLFTQAGTQEIALLSGILKQKGGEWTVAMQLATCVRDEHLLREVSKRIINTMNAAVYVSVLQSSYAVQYNRKFREIFWQGIADLTLTERQLLFSVVETSSSEHIAQMLIHSARSLAELKIIMRLLPSPNGIIQLNIDYLVRKLSWIETTAVSQINEFLVRGA